jgi:hypothetical protein
LQNYYSVRKLMRIGNTYSREPEETVLPNYEGMEGQHDWAGLWRLNPKDMTWWRPQHYYFRSAVSGLVEQYEQLHRGPMVRPGPLREVGALNVPLAVLRSHPNYPGTLDINDEGKWLSTNAAWPDRTVNAKIGRGVIAAWDDCSPALTETYELVPDYAGEVDPAEAEAFDPTPLSLIATVVYIKPYIPNSTIS